MPKLKHLFTKAAAQGPLIVRALARDSGSAHALKTENNPSLKTALDNAQRFFANDEAIADEQAMADFGWTLLTALLQATDPTFDHKNKFSGWIMKVLAQAIDAGTPVKAEDLYKIRGQLAYFESAAAHIQAQGQKTDIQAYATYKEFSHVVDPLMIARDIKRAKHGLSDEICAKTTFLYEGPEGRIVVPHTMRACQFWGQGTKWCIAAKDAEDNHFDTYNERGPILIFIPAITPEMKSRYPDYTSFKCAIVANELYDETDETLDEKPTFLRHLIAVANKGPVAPYLKHFTTIKPQEEENVADPAFFPSNCDPSWIPILEQVRKQPNVIADHHQNLIRNRDFMLAAVTKNGWALEYAAPELKADREIVVAAVTQNGEALCYAAPKLQADHEIVLAAFTHSGGAYRSAAEFKDRDFVLAAVTQNGMVLRYAAPELFADKQFCLDILQIAQKSDEKNRQAIMTQLHRFPAFFGGPFTMDAGIAIAHMLREYPALRQEATSAPAAAPA